MRNRKVAPHPPAAHYVQQALTLHQQGDLHQAEQLYHSALAADPGDFDALHLMGVLRHQQGRSAEALRLVAAALGAQPGSADALTNYGVILDAVRRHREALDAFEKVLASRPADATAHYHKGLALSHLSRHAEALTSFDRALALAPRHADALLNRGNTLYALGRYDEALADYDKALMLRPNHVATLNRRGGALHKLGQYEAAAASFNTALKLRPDHAEAHARLGNSLHALHRHDEALASHDRALALAPNLAEAHSNRGNALLQMRRFDEALDSYDRAIALRPDFADAYCNRGTALQELRRFDEALESYERAQKLRPDLAEAHFSEALCRLVLGDFARGWQQHEWRWHTAQLKAVRRNFPQPQWTGAQDIAGKTVVLHAEQGFGDTLQFCRYVPDVAALGARVILEVQRPLVELMSTLGGPVQIVSHGDTLPDFDLHCPLLSLPLAFGTRLDSIPSRTPYLFVPQEKKTAWCNRFVGRERPRIGLVWAGDPRKNLPHASRIDRQRSLTFDELQPVLEVSGCDFFSLQKGDEAQAQLRGSAIGRDVIDWSADFHDFSDTAALIENLDLVIAVDTAVAHLAGALGKPVWLINRYNTCWRWLLDRDDSPWYPTARIFRQDETRTWDGVIARLQAALQDFVSG